VLADKCLGVQIGDVELTEFRAQVLLQLRLGPVEQLAHLAERTPGLRGHRRQPVWPEDDQRDHRKHQHLGEIQVKKHRRLRSRWAELSLAGAAR
jgi:hypothetical protein